MTIFLVLTRYYNYTHWLNMNVCTLYLLVLSADSLCKQIGPRSGPTKFGSNLFDTQMVFLNFFLKKLILKKISRRQKKHEQRVKICWKTVRLMTKRLQIQTHRWCSVVSLSKTFYLQCLVVHVVDPGIGFDMTELLF